MVAIAYMARRRLDRSVCSLAGWSSIARYIIGSPKSWVIRSVSISSSTAWASKARKRN